jgi:hypothetical protein
MPQGRRKTPFSGKAKKEQLFTKRTEKAEKKTFESVEVPSAQALQSVAQNAAETTSQVMATSRQKDRADTLMDVTFSSGNQGRQRYELIFQRESKAEVNAARERATHPYKSITNPEELEIDVDSYFPGSCDYPKRPGWDSSMSKAKLEADETKYFRDYVNKIMDEHEHKLSYFELNLEVLHKLFSISAPRT